MGEQQETGQQYGTQLDFPTILKGVTNYAGIQKAIGETVNAMKERGGLGREEKNHRPTYL